MEEPKQLAYCLVLERTLIVAPDMGRKDQRESAILRQEDSGWWHMVNVNWFARQERTGA
jgi:hypothetical protein